MKLFLLLEFQAEVAGVAGRVVGSINVMQGWLRREREHSPRQQVTRMFGCKSASDASNPLPFQDASPG